MYFNCYWQEAQEKLNTHWYGSGHYQYVYYYYFFVFIEYYNIYLHGIKVALATQQIMHYNGIYDCHPTEQALFDHTIPHNHNKSNISFAKNNVRYTSLPWMCD